MLRACFLLISALAVMCHTASHCSQTRSNPDALAQCLAKGPLTNPQLRKMWTGLTKDHYSQIFPDSNPPVEPLFLPAASPYAAARLAFHKLVRSSRKRQRLTDAMDRALRLTLACKGAAACQLVGGVASEFEVALQAYHAEEKKRMHGEGANTGVGDVGERERVGNVGVVQALFLAYDSLIIACVLAEVEESEDSLRKLLTERSLFMNHSLLHLSYQLGSTHLVQWVLEASEKLGMTPHLVAARDKHNLTAMELDSSAGLTDASRQGLAAASKCKATADQGSGKAGAAWSCLEIDASVAGDGRGDGRGDGSGGGSSQGGAPGWLGSVLQARGPVVIRQAVGAPALGTFLRRIGFDGFDGGPQASQEEGQGATAELEVGPIPYAAALRGGGASKRTMQLAQYLALARERARGNGQSEDGEGVGGGEEVLYAFEKLHSPAKSGSDASSSASSALWGASSAVLGPQLPREVRAQQSYQFAVGYAGTGAPLHFHNLAFNVLAAGQKEWLFLPPANATWSVTPIGAWLDGQAGGRQGWGGDGQGVGRCVQYPGDVVFVPQGWTHGTLNKEGVAVAVSAELPDIMLDVFDFDGMLAARASWDCFGAA